MCLAAILGIDKSVYETAEIDGGSELRPSLPRATEKVAADLHLWNTRYKRPLRPSDWGKIDLEQWSKLLPDGQSEILNILVQETFRDVTGPNL